MNVIFVNYIKNSTISHSFIISKWSVKIRIDPKKYNGIMLRPQKHEILFKRCINWDLLNIPPQLPPVVLFKMTCLKNQPPVFTMKSPIAEYAIYFTHLSEMLLI